MLLDSTNTGSTTGGYGSTNTSSSTGIVGTPVSGRETSGSTNYTAGPHDSNIANKADPRVDSDRDGSATYGNTSSTNTGSHTGGFADRSSGNNYNSGDKPYDSFNPNVAESGVPTSRETASSGNVPHADDRFYSQRDNSSVGGSGGNGDYNTGSQGGYTGQNDNNTAEAGRGSSTYGSTGGYNTSSTSDGRDNNFTGSDRTGTGNNYDNTSSSSYNRDSNSNDNDRSRSANPVAGNAQGGYGNTDATGPIRSEHEHDKTGVIAEHQPSDGFSSDKPTSRNADADRGPNASVTADPSSAPADSQKHQGADRPNDEPTGDEEGAVRASKDKAEASQDKGATSGNMPGQPGSEGLQKESQGEGTGEQWVKSSGMKADGGDFDAAAPGAGREADREFATL